MAALVTLGVLLIMAAFAPLQPVLAHGKELSIQVDSLVPDPDQPLRVLYRVTAVYAGDEDPVGGAVVVMTSSWGGDEEVPLRLTEVEGSEGIYVGEAVFRRFGEWDVHLDVEATLGLGSGSVDFVDAVRPEQADAALEAARRAEAERVASLQLLFGFDWWPDVVTVISRILHSVAGLAYFIATGLVFSLAWFGIPARRASLLSEVRRLFLPVALLSLGALLVAGLYGAAFDAPVAWPGLYDLDAMLSIPYGDAYLVAFSLKVVAFVLLLILAFRISGTLRRWTESPVPEGDVETIARLKNQTLASALLGLFIVADVAVVIYLHYISHLAVFVA